MSHRLQNRRPDQFRILVVIDEIYAQKAVIEYVRQEGYRVSGLWGVKEALRTFVHGPAHLVIADLTRPQLHAAEMVAALKKHHHKLYAVGVIDQLPAVEAQAEDGFEGYIVKPISRENDSAQLRELLLTPSEERRPTVIVLNRCGRFDGSRTYARNTRVRRQHLRRRGRSTRTGSALSALLLQPIQLGPV